MRKGLHARALWFIRTERLRELQPPAFLSAMCAAAVAPVVATAAGMTDLTGLAGMNVLAAIGGGVFSTIAYDALSNLRKRGERREPTQAEVEAEIKALLEERLAAGGDTQSLSVAIFALLRKVDAGKVIAEAAGEADTRTAVFDLVAAVNRLGDDYSFLLDEVALRLADIRADIRGLSIEAAQQTAYERMILRIVTGIWIRLGIEAGDLQDTVSPTVTGPPYLGLMPFEEKNAAVFYGRQAMADKLVDKVADRLAHGGLLVLTGASGTGKSSLLRAGLLPMLGASKRLPGSEHWIRGVITPGGDPLGELASFLTGLSRGGRNWAQFDDDLLARPDKAHLTFREALILRDQIPGQQRMTVRRDGTRILLIVDQFEEVFALGEGPDADARRRAFLTALRSAASVHGRDGPAAIVIIAVRTDYLDACLSDAELGAVNEQLGVGQMTDTELKLTITGPAEAAGLRIDDGLVGVILDDVRAVGQDTMAGVLPLLSVAMHRTWQLRDQTRNALTSYGYERSGGVRRAVEEAAERVYEKLQARDQELARSIFCQLTLISHDHKISRRPVRRQEIFDRLPAAGRPAIDTILDKFAAERLITLDENRVQLTHDILLTAWPRLKNWLDEDRADLMLLAKLEDDAAQWRALRKDDAFLYRGLRLVALQEFDDRATRESRYAFPEDQREFLIASTRAATRRSRTWRAVAVTGVVLLVLAAAGLTIAVSAADNATQQRDLAMSGQLAALSEGQDQDNPVLAAQLAAAAWQAAQTDQAQESLLTVLAQPVRAVFTAGGPANWAVFSPRGAVLATAGKSVQLWNAASGRAIGSPLPVSGGANRAAFSPDGRWLATADRDGTVRVWDAATRRELGAPLVASVGSGVNAVAFSPRGGRGGLLATADGDGTARLWDVATGRQLGAPLVISAAATTGDQVTDVAFSPDGKVLATASLDGAARLWDVATHRQTGLAMNCGDTPSFLDEMRVVLFSPDGATLATGCGDGLVRLWSVSDQRQRGPSIPGAEGVGDVAFSPDGSLLAVGENAGAIRLLNIATRVQITSVPALASGDVRSVSFSPDGATLASVSFDGTTRLWNMSLFHNLGWSADVGGFSVAAFSPDGRSLATAGLDGMVSLWDLASGRQERLPTAIRENGVSAMAFSPDGRSLATAGVDGMVRLWDLASGRQSGRAIAVSHSTVVSAVAFSPDGLTLATAAGYTVRMWDVTSGRQSGTPISLSAQVIALEFSPRGTIVATVTLDQSARLWDVATRRQVATLGTLHGVSAVTFSPDGGTLATAQSDGTARLWDIATGREVGAPMIATLMNQVEGVAFNRAGTMLATAGQDGSLRLWDVATRHEIGPAMQAGSNVSGVQSVAFSANGATLAAIGPREVASLWDVTFPRDLLGAVCALAGRPLTRQEWSTYLQSAPYVSACP
jgi:WD40 repeat protein